MVRPLACFETAEPLLGRNGDPPGGEIALIFEDRLRRSGVEIAEGVDVHGGYGWSFVAVMEGARIWCLLQLSDEWLLITRPLRSAMDRLRGRSHTEQHARLCGV